MKYYSRNNIRLPDMSLNDIAYQSLKQAKLRFCLWKDMLQDEDFKGKMNYQAVREKLSGIRRVKKRDVFSKSHVLSGKTLKLELVIFCFKVEQNFSYQDIIRND